MIIINMVWINKYIILAINQGNKMEHRALGLTRNSKKMKWNIGRWTARGIPRKMPNGSLKATPREVLKRNAKRVSKGDASRGLENKCHSRVSEVMPHKGLIRK